MTPAQPDGYLAIPVTQTGSPVLVLHAWWGLNSTIKSFCDRLAEEGFTAFAPDLYHGKVTDQISVAETMVADMESSVPQARADLAQAVPYLLDRAGAGYSSIAVIGFSMGAFYALDLSASMPDVVRSVVVYYGAGPADFSLSKAEYLGHFAADDPYEPQENLDYLKDALNSAGRTATFHLYNGAGHWFAESDRADAYNAEAAGLAWDRTLAFLKRPVSA